eukprot:6129017-Amphidinium_carterae.3
MVRARQLSDQAQSSNSSIAQLEKHYKDQLSRVIKIVKRHVDSRGPTLEYLKSCGWTEESAPVAVQASLSTQAKLAAVETKRAKKVADIASRPEGVAAKDDLGSKYWTISAMSATVLIERILPGISPTLMSTGNLQAQFEKKATADAKKDVVLRLLEYTTGEAPSFSLKGRFRDVQKLIEHLTEQYRLRARLTPEMVLPLNYDVHGIYKVHTVDRQRDEVVVNHGFTGQQKALPVGDFGFKVPDDAAFVIMENHSEQNARLTIKDDDFEHKGLKLGGYFAEQYVVQRAIKGAAAAAAAESPKRKNSSTSSAATSSSKKRKVAETP